MWWGLDNGWNLVTIILLMKLYINDTKIKIRKEKQSNKKKKFNWILVQGEKIAIKDSLGITGDILIWVGY